MAFAIELSTEHSVIQMLRTGFGDHPVSAGLGWAEIIYAKKKVEIKEMSKYIHITLVL